MDEARMTGARDQARISVVIPTWRREAVLVQTLRLVLELLEQGDELIVVDQTPEHEPATAAALRAWEAQGRLRLLRRDRPSIPAAMNAGLLAARGELVLFLDDDVIPDAGLLRAHRRAHAGGATAVVAGRVIQPWDKSPATAGRNRFAATQRAEVEEFIGCNFSVRRDGALALGGFDEKFVRAAYRFEREFAGRVRDAGGRILFEPDAAIEHLKAGGGIRAWGETWASPGHAVGEYYCLLRSPRERHRWLRIAVHPLRAVRTRFHLRRPWLIPVTLAAELTAFGWALKLRLGPPELLRDPEAQAAAQAEAPAGARRRRAGS